MSESKYSQSDELGDISLSNVISSVLRNKKSCGFFQERHDLQSWLINIAFQLPKYSANYLLSQLITWSQRTGNRIQSRTL